MTAPIDRVLPLLAKVKAKRKAGEWLACCPAHDDKHPSLSIREGPDGTVLIRCWSGCSTAAVLYAIGLEFSDLFPHDHRAPGRAPGRQKLGRKALDFERLVYSTGKAQLARFEPFNDQDRTRFFLACERLRDAGELTQ